MCIIGHAKNTPAISKKAFFIITFFAGHYHPDDSISKFNQMLIRWYVPGVTDGMLYHATYNSTL